LLPEPCKEQQVIYLRPAWDVLVLFRSEGLQFAHEPRAQPEPEVAGLQLVNDLARGA